MHSTYSTIGGDRYTGTSQPTTASLYKAPWESIETFEYWPVAGMNQQGDNTGMSPPAQAAGNTHQRFVDDPDYPGGYMDGTMYTVPGPHNPNDAPGGFVLQEDPRRPQNPLSTFGGQAFCNDSFLGWSDSQHGLIATSAAEPGGSSYNLSNTASYSENDLRMHNHDANASQLPCWGAEELRRKIGGESGAEQMGGHQSLDQNNIPDGRGSHEEKKRYVPMFKHTYERSLIVDKPLPIGYCEDASDAYPALARILVGS
ncbi:hypothetical protein QFC22_006278 [Naganishia vaughanmartiniae]|uniref:Uncharacterized protein n=1 Tax=Naganishia vaughanmartiniae TaxID=1424756 RepID=A0ACC2WM57_9TREE|nr:hypothetical protein QFC22_006278 [Naganishia vaughanmartiniae]